MSVSTRQWGRVAVVYAAHRCSTTYGLDLVLHYGLSRHANVSPTGSAAEGHMPGALHIAHQSLGARLAPGCSIMRVDRAKNSRRSLRFFKVSYGLVPPFHVSSCMPGLSFSAANTPSRPHAATAWG